MNYLNAQAATIAQFSGVLTHTNVMKKAKKVILIAVAVGLTAVAAAGLAGFILLEPNVKINGFIELDAARLDCIDRTVTVEDASGKAIDGPLYGANRIYSPLCEMPSYLPKAFVAVEDKRFYSHRGVDYRRVLSAAVTNLRSGGFREGASTITQQLIKNTHLSGEKTLSRKLQEIRLSRALERKMNKDEILEAYLNILYFGGNSYGVGTAARNIFDKSVSELTLGESALLAGMINSPARFDPFTEREAAIKRRDTVLLRMSEQKMISDSEYAAAKNEIPALSDKLAPCNQYVGAAIGEACEILHKDRADIFTGGYTVKTFFSPSVQDKIDCLIASLAPDNADLNVIVAENRSGRFVANSGNSTLDLSVRRRSPGSTIKPFLCYLPALENKSVYPITPILDERTAFGEWRPGNYNDKYYGWTSVKESLVRSLNVPAVKLLEANGIENSKRVAGRFGIDFGRGDNSLALALGNMSRGVTLAELSDAYRALAAGGMYSPGKYVSEIYDRDGKCLYRYGGPRYLRACSEDNAYLITDMLSECAKSGTARQVGFSGTHAAAKTGTVGTKAGNTDAYCIAYTPEYTVAVWAGNRSALLDNSVSGGTVPARLGRRVLEYLGDKSEFAVPDGITAAEIDLAELKNNRKVLLAGDGVKEKDRLTVLFSSANMPRAYSRPKTFIEKESVLDEFDNFEIVD